MGLSAKIVGICKGVLESLGITSGGVYTSASSAPTLTGTTALIVGDATTSGVRLDLESGDLAVREGDDSAYANARALALMVGSTQDVGLGRLSAGIAKVTDGSTGLGKLQVANGTGALPAITGADLDSGIAFEIVGGGVSIASNGGEKLRVEPTQVSVYVSLTSNGSTIYGFRRAPWPYTADQALTSGQHSFSTMSNAGASGEVIMTLPGAVAGTEMRFIVEAAQYLRVKAATGDLIRGTRNANVVAGTIESSATAGYWRSNVAGAWIQVEGVDATTWQVVGIGGTWTIDS